MQVKLIGQRVLGLILLCGVIFLITRLSLFSYFPINTVKIYGLNNTSHNEIKKLLINDVHNDFFHIDVGVIKQKILQLPWAEQVIVQRHWPNEIDVTVIERKPFALWNKHQLLSTRGDVFTPSSLANYTLLPHFVGPVGMQVLMLAYYHEINRLLLPIHLQIQQLELKPYAMWRVILNNGIVVHAGHQDAVQRFTRFVNVYSKIIADKANDVEYVDLRYSNGIAISWKKRTKV